MTNYGPVAESLAEHIRLEPEGYAETGFVKQRLSENPKNLAVILHAPAVVGTGVGEVQAPGSWQEQHGST